MQDILARLRPKLKKFCRSRPIKRLAVFGSIAQGMARADSDLDVLVTLQPGLSHMEVFRMAGEIEDVAQRPVDFVVSETLDASKNRRKRDAILRSAIVIYER